MTPTPEQIAAGLNVMAKKILLNGDWERGSLPVVHPRVTVARLKLLQAGLVDQGYFGLTQRGLAVRAVLEGEA